MLLLPSPPSRQCSVKNCTIPFHVTCAFEHSLEMKTILDEGDEVKFKSYCLKHSKPKDGVGGGGGGGDSGLSPSPTPSPARPTITTTKPHATDTEKTGLRAQKLLELEEEFYSLVQPAVLAQELGLVPALLDFIYQYWKLKRKGNFNKPLLPPKEEEENQLLQPQEDSIHTRMRMFMHLRQDLERVSRHTMLCCSRGLHLHCITYYSTLRCCFYLTPHCFGFFVC